MMIRLRLQISAVLVFLFFVCKYGVFGGTFSNILKSTQPAYTMAIESQMLDDLSVCRKEMNLFRKAVEEKKLWGLRMLDASGEPRAGFFYGNNFWLGVKSQCLDLHNRNPLDISPDAQKNNSIYQNVNENFPPFRINYFAAHFRHNSTMQYHIGISEEQYIITLGLCLPKSCTIIELSKILRKIFKERMLIANVLQGADYQLLHIKDLEDNYQYFTNGKIIIIGSIVFITLLMMGSGTIYDLYVNQNCCNINNLFQKNQKNNKKIKKGLLNDKKEILTPLSKIKTNIFGRIILCFSIYTNTKSLLNTKQDSDSIQVIYGLRFISMLWIILIHIPYFTKDYTDNLAWSLRIVHGVPGQIVSNGILAVDTFFFLSGFLAAQNFYKQEIKKKNHGESPTKFSGLIILKAIFKRFIRLTPAYIMTLGILQILFSHFDKTTQFYMSESVSNCDKYMWRNILYINNLFSVDDMCATWSWYLPNDMQFFIIAKILTVFSVTYFNTSAAVWAGLIILTIGYNGYLSYTLNFIYTLDMQWKTRDYLYTSPFVRIGPYLIGIAVANLLIRMNSKWSAKTKTVWIMWILGAIANFGTIFIMYDRQIISVFTTSIYVAFNKTIWGLGIGWIVFACSTGHGGLINNFLSMNIFIPLGKLTYCAYLVNPIIISVLYLGADVSAHSDILLQLPVFLGSVIITYFAAYILYIMFEIPYVSLLKILT